MIKYEYVFSGLSMMKINKITTKQKEIIELMINDITSKYNFANIGFLYNAMTESNYSKYYTKLDLPLYADSGGLQLAILGLDKNTIEDKKIGIYDNQAKNADYGFIFDEMPIILDQDNIVDTSSNRVDNSSRIFLHDMVEPSAIKTAENVKKQINHIRDNNSKAKVFIIGQGNDFYTFNKYISTIVNYLSDDEQKCIKGIAPSDTCYGLGTLERWDILYQIKKYDIPDEIKKNIHLLGVGAINGFLPVLLSPDYFNFIDTLSFDSTSSSRKYGLDGLYNGERLNKNNKSILAKQYFNIYNDIKKYLALVEIDSFQKFITKCTYLSENNSKDVWIYNEGDTQSRLGYIIMSLYNGLIYTDDIFRSIQNWKTKMPFELRDYEDFQYFKREIVQYYKLTSKKVKSFKNLDEFNKTKEINNIISSLF